VRSLHRASTLLVVSVLSTLVLVGIALAATPLGNPRAETQSLIKSIESRPGSAKLAKQPLDEAHQALDRAHQARRAGDYQHAGMLESLALEWAETARDLARAAGAEAQAGKLQKRAASAERKATRARALLEETIARRGRARTRLEQLEKAGAHPTPPKQNEAHHGKHPVPARPAPHGGSK